MELTKEEIAEFNAFNTLAFDLARVNAGSTKISCWLCTDDDSKAKCRQDMVEHLNKLEVTVMPINILDADQIIDLVFKDVLASQVEKWKLAELEAKKARAEGSPHAFFV